MTVNNYEIFIKTRKVDNIISGNATSLCHFKMTLKPATPHGKFKTEIIRQSFFYILQDCRFGNVRDHTMHSEISVTKTNIAIVGGGPLCIDILEKTTISGEQSDIDARIVAVSDTDPDSPGMRLAGDLGLSCLTDYRKLYAAKLNINLIIILTPGDNILTEIIGSRPSHIRILSYEVFQLFWDAINAESRKLKDRNREIETILDGIRNFICVISPDKEMLFANETFMEKMKFNREDVIGKKCYQVFQKRETLCEPETISCPLENVVRNKRKIEKVYKRTNKKGELRYIELTIFPIWGEGGKIQKFIEISRDITERKMQEDEITRQLEQMVEERTRELRETHEKLMHKDKMSSLGKLSASVVHEINNPIAGVLNLILLMKRIMAEDSIDEEEMNLFKRYIGLMEAETRRIGRIVSNLLAFSRQSRIELEELNVNKLIDKTLFLNDNLLKIYGVSVQRKYSVKIPAIVSSKDQLQQVFMNLISNAAESMKKTNGGLLTISTGLSNNGTGIKVSFRDTGIGITKINQQKLFEPFFTTKTKGKGVGLGLSVVYGIIQEHGGTIRVSSKEKHGALFELDLPFRKRDHSQAAAFPPSKPDKTAFL